MPAHSDSAGKIILEQAYATSKMLDSSGWNGLLRSKITPSDVDHPPVGLCFYNNGAILFADFSVNCDDWGKLRRTLKGQRWLYESIIRHGPHCAVLCKHNVRPEMCRPIDTLGTSKWLSRSSRLGVSPIEPPSFGRSTRPASAIGSEISTSCCSLPPAATWEARPRARARPSVLHARRREHSRKPNEVYALIEGMYPRCRRSSCSPAKRGRDGTCGGTRWERRQRQMTAFLNFCAACRTERRMTVTSSTTNTAPVSR
jgi:hypothetical protein